MPTRSVPLGLELADASSRPLWTLVGNGQQSISRESWTLGRSLILHVSVLSMSQGFEC